MHNCLIICTLLLRISKLSWGFQNQRLITKPWHGCQINERCNIWLGLKAASDDDAILNDEIFSRWEQEEKSLQLQEAKERIQKVKETDNELPEYMLRILEQFGEHVSEGVADPVPASKLPIVAIIGRPNTGKSTIVNKLSGTYQVTIVWNG